MTSQPRVLGATICGRAVMSSKHLPWAFACPLLLGACAGAPPSPDSADDTDVLLMDIVVEKCKVPELQAYFHLASAEFAGSHENLDRLAECLTEGPLKGEQVRLIGHTDPTGSEAFNQKLGLSRAQRVGQYLSKQGVSADRIRYESRGPKEASGDPERYPNERRVDIQILLGRAG